MKGNSSLAIFSTVFAILLFLSEISGHAASAENGVTSPTIGLLGPFDDDFNLTPIFGQALRRARLGDDSSIDIVLRISMNADGMAAEVIGRLVWPVLLLRTLNSRPFHEPINPLSHI